MTTIYHLWSRSKSPAHEATEWLRDVAPAMGLCSGCGRFRVDRAIDVPLHQPLDGSALNFFWSTGLGIAHVKFLDALGRELVLKSLRLGRILETRGRPLPDFRTFQAVSFATIRGGPTSKVRRCEVCRAILYAPVKMHHLVGSASEYKGLLGTNLAGSLIADEDAVDKIPAMRLKNLGISKLRVVNDPLDGKPANLECS